MLHASQQQLKGVLAYVTDELVSIDFNHSPFLLELRFDATQVVDGKLVRVRSWYDNEWGFSNRMLRHRRRHEQAALSVTWRSIATSSSSREPGSQRSPAFATFRDKGRHLGEVTTTATWQRPRASAPILRSCTTSITSAGAHYANVKPNAAHLALARLEREHAGSLTIVTQNIRRAA
ncbi:MAG: hypothetical protein WDN31_17625 [Hyphomicrobium sp.]